MSLARIVQLVQRDCAAQALSIGLSCCFAVRRQKAWRPGADEAAQRHALRSIYCCMVPRPESGFGDGFEQSLVLVSSCTNSGLHKPRYTLLAGSPSWPE